MAAISLTYDIVANTEVQALPLQTNFQELENYINGSVIRADGVVGMDPGTQLLLAGDATSALAAATKQQVDAGDALKLSLTGGTVTGAVTIDNQLTVGGTGQALRIRDTVDDSHYVQFLTENLTANRDWTFPNANGTFASEAYVDAKTWNGNDITAGTVAFARLPTGTSSSTVAIGNHNHSGVYANSSHNHSGADITSGTVAFARLPTGTSSSTVAVGNHSHSGSSITSGTVAYARLPTGTSSSTVAIGNHNHSGVYANASHDHNGLTIGPSTSARLLVQAGSATNCAIQKAGDANTGIYWSGADNIWMVGGGDLGFGCNNGGAYIPNAYSSTTSGIGGTFYDVQVNSGGRIACVFSSERFKENVTPITTEEAYKVLDLEPVTYNGIGSDVTEVGRIAEHAAEITPLLVKWDDELGIPNSYDYSREVVLLTEVVKDLRARIEQLEAV